MIPKIRLANKTLSPINLSAELPCNRTLAAAAPWLPGTVKNYLVESILLLICCSGIFAIPAIIYAAQVNGKLQAGDYQGAVQASNSAKTWCIVALCIGIGCNVLMGGFMMMGAALENM